MQNFLKIWARARIGVLSFMVAVLLAGAGRAHAQKRPVRELELIKNMDIGPCSDAAVSNGVLFVIGNGTIYSFDISNARQPVLLGSLGNLGNVRQIEVEDGFAFITSREEGMFIVDVSNPRNLVLASHYDTLELGTGVAVNGPLVAVANRNYGVELVDVSDKTRPRFLGAIRTGEAQSVFLRDTLLFAGNWAERKVTICNVADPTHPQIISEMPLEGYGDGIFVRGNLCFAATGHHAPGLKEYLNPKDPFFGKGHGFEIFDISNLSNPVRLSRINFPVQFLRHYDFWDVQVAGGFAFVGDSGSGIFAVDIKNLKNPRLVGRRQLPMVMQEGIGFWGPVGGFALGKDVVYTAGKLTDLHLLDAKGLSQPLKTETPTSHAVVSRATGAAVPANQYRPDGAVHGVFISDEKEEIFIAAGNAGVHQVFLAPKLAGKEILRTGNVVFDVSVVGDKMFLAEGIAGMSVWNFDRKSPPVLLGRYKPAEGGVFQLAVNASGKNAGLQVGRDVLDIVDLSNPAQIVRSIKFVKNAPLYRLPISRGLYKGSVISCKWHGIGFFVYDLNGKPGKEELIKVNEPGGAADGAAWYGDQLLTIANGGYSIKSIQNLNLETAGALSEIPGLKIAGKATLFGSDLFVSHRMSGAVSAIDIRDDKKPVARWMLKMSGNPGLIQLHKDAVLIPAGRGGLHVYHRETGKPYAGQ
jgi:hypothetical protein